MADGAFSSRSKDFLIFHCCFWSKKQNDAAEPRDSLGFANGKKSTLVTGDFSLLLGEKAKIGRSGRGKVLPRSLLMA